jgi:hypothetical protein
MNDTIFTPSGLQQIGSTAQSIVAKASQFIQFALSQVVQLILSIALPLSLALLLMGVTLYFSHLNRRMGRDFIVLSVVLALLSQIFQVRSS